MKGWSSATNTWGGGRGGSRAGFDERADLADLHLVTLLGLVGQLAGDLGGDLGGHLVGFQGQDRLVGGHGGPVGLEPRGEDAGGNTFADGGNFDFGGHGNGEGRGEKSGVRDGGSQRATGGSGDVPVGNRTVAGG